MLYTIQNMIPMLTDAAYSIEKAVKTVILWNINCDMLIFWNISDYYQCWKLLKNYKASYFTVTFDQFNTNNSNWLNKIIIKKKKKKEKKNAPTF